MVNIKLDSNYNLESDFKQWIISKDGRNLSFHMQLENAICSYFERKIRGSQAKTISGLVEYHKRVLESLQQSLSRCKIGFDTENKTNDLNNQLNNVGDTNANGD